jgi:hypothetical protein
MNTSSNITPSFQQGGIQMSGSNTDGGGGSFYLGGDEQNPEEEQNPQNPELVLANPGEVDRRSENRQYLESLIIERPLAWLSPWLINPSDNLKSRRKDLIVQPAEPKKTNKRFLVNA